MTEITPQIISKRFIIAKQKMINLPYQEETKKIQPNNQIKVNLI